MAVRDIVLAPDPRLKKKCSPVSEIDGDLQVLLDDMLETMYAANGIGLAAPQVGEEARVIVMDVAERPKDGTDAEPQRRPMKLINPEVVWESEEGRTYEEGCLSIPDHYGDVTRPERVRVTYLDETGEKRELEADGLLATCVQHEIDHLNGVLFIDHLSALKRNLILKKMRKLKKQKDRDQAA